MAPLVIMHKAKQTIFLFYLRQKLTRFDLPVSLSVVVKTVVHLVVLVLVWELFIECNTLGGDPPYSSPFHRRLQRLGFCLRYRGTDLRCCGLELR